MVFVPFVVLHPVVKFVIFNDLLVAYASAVDQFVLSQENCICVTPDSASVADKLKVAVALLVGLADVLVMFKLVAAVLSIIIICSTIELVLFAKSIENKHNFEFMAVVIVNEVDELGKVNLSPTGKALYDDTLQVFEGLV